MKHSPRYRNMEMLLEKYTKSTGRQSQNNQMGLHQTKMCSTTKYMINKEAISRIGENVYTAHNQQGTKIQDPNKASETQRQQYKQLCEEIGKGNEHTFFKRKSSNGYRYMKKCSGSLSEILAITGDIGLHSNVLPTPASMDAGRQVPSFPVGGCVGQYNCTLQKSLWRGL